MFVGLVVSPEAADAAIRRWVRRATCGEALWLDACPTFAAYSEAAWNSLAYVVGMGSARRRARHKWRGKGACWPPICPSHACASATGVPHPFAPAPPTPLHYTASSFQLVQLCKHFCCWSAAVW